jgi:hypothetical protein
LYGKCLGCGVEKKLSFFPVELVGMGSNLVEWKHLHLKKPDQEMGGL